MRQVNTLTSVVVILALFSTGLIYTVRLGGEYVALAPPAITEEEEMLTRQWWTQDEGDPAPELMTITQLEGESLEDFAVRVRAAKAIFPPVPPPES